MKNKDFIQETADKIIESLKNGMHHGLNLGKVSI